MIPTNNEHENKIFKPTPKLPFKEGLEPYISEEVWNALSPVEQRNFLSDNHLEHLYRDIEVSVKKTTEYKEEKNVSGHEKIAVLPEKYQQEYEQLNPNITVSSGSDKTQVDLERGQSFNSGGSSMNKPSFIGYQADDQSIQNYKTLKRGGAKKSSTWLAYVIQKWFESIMQLS